MNRRKFIASGAMSATLLSVFPSFALVENKSITLSSLGDGFSLFDNELKSLSVTHASEGIRNTHQRLTQVLNKSGYLYNPKSMIRLNGNSYMIPLLKKSMLGVETKEIALIVKEGFSSEFYLLNEKISEEFNGLINGFDSNMKQHNIHIKTSDFSFPVKVVKQTVGVENTFVYKNKFNDTITLHNFKKKTKAIIS